jgi:hypothetical protein
MASKKTRGILLLAVGHPYYGDMAVNLAMSLKFTAPEIPITLVTDTNGMRYIDAQRQKLFDGILTCPDEYTTFRGRKSYVKPKVYLNHFSPYDQTIFLDVDMIMTPKKSIRDVFDECDGVQFTMQNRGHLDLAKVQDPDAMFIIWASTGKIKDAFGFESGKLYNLSSEFIYWEKSKKTDGLFARAQSLFESPKVRHIDFGGGVPDELPFTCSMIEMSMYPHKDVWRPIFWESFDKVQPQEKIINERFFGVSLGGNIVPKYTRKIYTNLVKFYGKHHGLTTHRPIKDKRQFIQERKTI